MLKAEMIKAIFNIRFSILFDGIICYGHEYLTVIHLALTSSMEAGYIVKSAQLFTYNRIFMLSLIKSLIHLDGNKLVG